MRGEVVQRAARALCATAPHRRGGGALATTRRLPTHTHTRHVHAPSSSPPPPQLPRLPHVRVTAHEGPYATAILASPAADRSGGVASSSGRTATEPQPLRTRPARLTLPSGSSSSSSSNAGVRSAYIHLPFCKRKCFYCDFPVEAVGRDTAAPKVEARMRSYVDTVLQEVAATRRMGGGPLETVFFGGGTPSLVPPPLLALLLEALDRRFGIAAGAEVCMEADPGTFDADRLREYRALGVTRLSVGVQAFQQELLTACGRGHDLQEAEAAIEAIQAAGLPSWSLDLISGLPGLTAEAWEHSVRRAVAAGPNHVSVYDLQVEEGTPFERWERAGKLRLPPDDSTVEMYGLASEVLKAAGYEHYEVSNYARPGHRCAHNQVYWRGLPYYAFGLGAASYLAGRRFSRPSKMREYVGWVEALAASEEGARGEALPGGHLPAESQEELLLDTLMLRLRTADGLDLAALRRRYGGAAAGVVLRALLPHERAGTVHGVDAGGRQCSLAEAAVATSPALSAAAAAAAARVAAPQMEPVASAGVGAAGVGEGEDGTTGLREEEEEEEEEEEQEVPGPGPAAGSAAALADAAAAGGGGVVRVRLADPSGFLLSNDIISDVFAAFDLSSGSKAEARGA